MITQNDLNFLKSQGISLLPVKIEWNIREVKESGEEYYILYLYEYSSEMICNSSILVACSKEDLKKQALDIYKLRL